MDIDFKSDVHYSRFGNRSSYPNRTFAAYGWVHFVTVDPVGSRGGGYAYYMPDEASFSAVSISSLGRDIKEKFANFMNRKKGYQLTKTTED